MENAVGGCKLLMMSDANTLKKPRVETFSVLTIFLRRLRKCFLGRVVPARSHCDTVSLNRPLPPWMTVLQVILIRLDYSESTNKKGGAREKIMSIPTTVLYSSL